MTDQILRRLEVKTVRKIYTLLFYLVLPLVFIRLAIRSRRLKDYRLRLRERLGFYPFRLDKCLWVHAVSVGEVIAAIPVIKALQLQYPQLPILITTMTPTGAARVKAAFGDQATHAYLPYDLPGAVNRFLKAMRPVAGVIIETEMWPNLLAACRRRSIPVCLTNARLSEKSARGYARFGAAALTREMLANLTHIAAVGHADAERFIKLGARPEQLTVTGNLKFDLLLPIDLEGNAGALRANLGVNRFVWIAASTHEGEEEVILEAHRRLTAQHPDALLMLVPRHPDRFNQIADLTAKQFTMQRRSANEPIQPETSVYLGDTMGEMLLMYAAADVALVAGSLIPRGGHNILEPAALAKPILSGPHVFNFAEICGLFTAQQALVTVTDADGLATQLMYLCQHAEERTALGLRARAVMDANRGSLTKQLAIIKKMIGVDAVAEQAMKV